ncbi:MAG: hypothetical protein K6T65_03505 [Peptococcaceae bacterium]|nr:hypothetical protein [Peptococcaceae bacterium]
MPFEIITRVDRDLSVDPSYIVRYQVFEDDHFLGDGVVQYHRLAKHNDFAIPGTIRRKDGSPLPGEARNKIMQSIHEAVKPHITSAL